MEQKIQVAPRTLARMFVAIPLSNEARQRLKVMVKQYDSSLERVVPEERWHITLAWLGKVPRGKAEEWQRITEPIQQIYVPVVRFSQVAQGRNKQQLWAYIQPTTALNNLRSLILKRFSVTNEEELNNFAPHVNLGRLKSEAQRFGPKTQAIGFSYVFDQVILYESDVSEKEPTYIPKSRIVLPAA